jgi:formylglycine-generating enzyme required for sulfatase activity
MKRLVVMFWLATIALMTQARAQDGETRGVSPPLALRPQAVFRDRRANGSDCPECPEMVVIAPGSFTMGATDQEEEREGVPLTLRRRAQPLTPINIPAAFAVGRYPVTFDEWDACVDAGGCARNRAVDLGWGRGRRPVIMVSWDDAQSYLRWLSARTGQSYRLLSEAEWEYVARAGTMTVRWWGDAARGGNANCRRCERDSGRTVVVGESGPNRFGVHDVLGNVWQWVEDCWNENYRSRPEDGRAWLSGNCTVRVARGGGFDDQPWAVRSASRGSEAAGNQSFEVGFRVARTLPR